MRSQSVPTAMITCYYSLYLRRVRQLIVRFYEGEIPEFDVKRVTIGSSFVKEKLHKLFITLLGVEYGRRSGLDNNAIERLNREIRRRTRVVGCFPDGNSALMLVCARLRHVAGTQWGNKNYMSMKHLEAMNDASIAG